MHLEWLVLLCCGALWVLHLLVLIRTPMARSAASVLIDVTGVVVTVGVGVVAPARVAATVAVASATVLLIAPNLMIRSAVRAARFGRWAWASALASLATVLRPTPAFRSGRRLVGIARRLGRGEPVDIVGAVDELCPPTLLERRLLELGMLAWTTDFAAMRRCLDAPGVRRAAIVRGAMGGVAVSAVGETGDERALVDLYGELASAPAFRRGRTDIAGALVMAAAYAGAHDLLRRHRRWLSTLVPAGQLAFAEATAAQRAGEPLVAASIVDAALRQPASAGAVGEKLRHRRHHVLPPAPDDVAFQRLRRDVARRLLVLRITSSLSFDRRQATPLTWIFTAGILVAYAAQSAVSPLEAFADWGLMRPWAMAPEPHRLLSYAFLHVDGWHLGLNVAGLLLFGRFVEQQRGMAWLGGTTLVGAVAGAGGFLFLAESHGGAVGASGAVLALFGMTLATFATDPVVRRSRPGRVELGFLLLVAVSQVAVDFAWAASAGSAHLGGMVAGLVLGVLASRGAPREA